MSVGAAAAPLPQVRARRAATRGAVLRTGERPRAGRRPQAGGRPALRAAALLFIAGLLAAALLVHLGTSVRSAPAPPSVGGTAVEPASSVVVGAGDTAWDIAARHAPPGTAVAEYAAAILASNGIDGRALQPGAVLVLP